MFTADKNVAAGAQILTWDAALYDDESLWDGAQQILCSRAGLWWVGAAAYRLSGAPSAASVIVRPQLNGVPVMDARSPAIAGAASAGVGSHLELAIGDALKLQVTFHATATTTADDAFTWLEAIRVGPVRYAGN